MELFRLRVAGVVVFVNLKHLLTSNDHQGPVHIEPKHLVHRHNTSAADAAGLPVFRGIVGDPPGAELTRLGSYRNRSLACALADEVRSERIGAAKEQRHITVAQDLLPLIIWEAVLKTRKVLKHSG